MTITVNAIANSIIITATIMTITIRNHANIVLVYCCNSSTRNSVLFDYRNDHAILLQY